MIDSGISNTVDSTGIPAGVAKRQQEQMLEDLTDQKNIKINERNHGKTQDNAATQPGKKAE